MTLGARIVAALALAALLPMAVVLAVFLARAERRASEETATLVTSAGRQARYALGKERQLLTGSADHAAAFLAADTAATSSLVRGPQPAATRVASGIAERFGLVRLVLSNRAGAVLASFGAEDSPPGEALLTENRTIEADGETVTMAASRALGAAFVADVSANTNGTARLRSAGAPPCGASGVEIPVEGEISLCVEVTPADAATVRRDVLRSFAGVAPLALLAALAVGLVLASRITRPIQDLAVRAEAISRERAHPITMLPDRDETRRMTVAFDQMLDALEMSERRRTHAERVAAWEEIAKRLAHEIKNPLSPIQLAVENLRRAREKAPESFDEALHVETRTILEEVGSLRTLVEEFARFARLPRPRPAAGDPKALVEQALAVCAPRIEAMAVTVSIDADGAPATLRADAEQIGRVLKNLIGNALDAMEDTPLRHLTIAVTARGPDVVFAVRDSGPGFDRESLRRAFTPYFTTRAGRGGTGLGLAIAQRIAIEHGGSLRAEGSEGRGATLTLTLPIAGPPREAA